jgi:hypothetical protein
MITDDLTMDCRDSLVNEFNKNYLNYSNISRRLELVKKDLSNELDKFIDNIMCKGTIDMSNINEIAYIRDIITECETKLNEITRYKY